MSAKYVSAEPKQVHKPDKYHMLLPFKYFLTRALELERVLLRLSYALIKINHKNSPNTTKVLYECKMYPI